MIRAWLQRRPALTSWLPVVLWAGLIFFLSSLSTLPHPPQAWLDSLASSLAHVTLFAVLAVLLSRALELRPWAWLAAFLLAVLYGASDELHQAFVPGRTPDVVDLACDSLGALVGVWAWRVWRRARALPRRARRRR